MWQRIDYEGFECAQERADYVSTTDKKIEEDVKLTASEGNLTNTLANVDALLKAEFNTPLVSASAHKLTPETLQTLAKMPEADTQDAIRALCGIDDLQLRPDVVARINTEIQNAAVLQDPDAIQKKCDLIMSLPKKSDSAKVKQHVKSLLYKHRGTKGEQTAIQQYEKEYDCTVKMQNSIFYRKKLNDTVCIGGRVDGIVNDRVIEVKCRQNRFFDAVPDYEYVQIMTYMALTDKSSCDVVQFFRNEIRVDSFDFDEEAWHHIRDAVVAFAESFCQFIDDEQMQDEFMKQFC